MGCGCSGIQSLGNVGPDGLGAYNLNPDGLGAWQPMWAAAGVGANPDGLGAVGGPALLGSVTGNVVLDTAIGGAIGYFLSPNEKDKKMWGAVGAGATLLAGTLGLVGVVGYALYQRRGR